MNQSMEQVSCLFISESGEFVSLLLKSSAYHALFQRQIRQTLDSSLAFELGRASCYVA